MTVKDYFNKVSVELSFKDPLLLQVSTIIGKKESKTINTMGLNTKSNYVILEYNSDWILSLSYETFAFCYSLELLRLLLKHPTNRLYDPKDISWIASNITLSELNIPIQLKMMIDMNYSVDDYGFKEKQAYETYWRLLYDIKDNLDKDSDECSLNETNVLNSKQLDDIKCIKDHFSKQNNSNHNWGENNSIDNDVESLVEIAKSSAKTWGSITGNMVEDIIAANTKKYNPMNILKHFSSSIKTNNKKSTRMKLNRRYGLVYPGTKRTKKSKVLFAIDISGSMTIADITDGINVINSCIKESNIDYLFFDTEIKGEVYKDLSKKIDTLSIKGRGGTDISCVINYLKKCKESYNGLICFSDGYYSKVSDRVSGIKYLWLTSANGQISPQEYGYKLLLDDISNNKYY